MHTKYSAMIASLMIAMAASAVAEEPKVVASATIPVYSSYLLRGQVLNDEAVVQPSATLSMAGFSFTAWGNFNLTDAYTPTTDSKFSEVDLTLSYSHRIGAFSIGVGLIEYLFPNQTLDGTREAYISAGLPDVFLSPTLTLYRDIDEVDGTYASLGFSRVVPLADKVSLALGASMGFADSDYNAFYFGIENDKLNDGNVSVGIPIVVSSNLTITPSIQYTWLFDNDISRSAGELYKGDDALWGGVSFTYSF